MSDAAGAMPPERWFGDCFGGRPEQVWLAPGRANQTVTLGVQQFVGQFLNDYPALLAALTMGAMPLVLLFVLFSRQFIRGVSQGFSK